MAKWSHHHPHYPHHHDLCHCHHDYLICHLLNLSILPPFFEHLLKVYYASQDLTYLCEYDNRKKSVAKKFTYINLYVCLMLRLLSRSFLSSLDGGIEVLLK